MTLPTGFYIVKGSHSRAFVTTNGDEIKGLPFQTDQENTGRLWLRPGNLADVVRPANLVDSISGKRFRYGGYIIEWPMQNLSPNMVNYLQQTYFDGNWTAALTIQTFNRANGNWEAYTAQAKWPDYINEAELAGGGFNNFKITFVNAELAPEGPNLVTAGEVDGTFILNGTGEYIVTVSNIGDDVTFSEIQVDVELPPDTEFSFETVDSTWDSFYSIDNGSTYSSIIPGDLTTITNVRWTTTDVVDVQSSLSDISLGLTFRAVDIIQVDFVVTMDGDTDDTDNTISFVADVPALPEFTGFDSGFIFTAYGPSDSGFSRGFDGGFGLSE